LEAGVFVAGVLDVGAFFAAGFAGAVLVAGFFAAGFFVAALAAVGFDADEPAAEAAFVPVVAGFLAAGVTGVGAAFLSVFVEPRPRPRTRSMRLGFGDFLPALESGGVR
jgi:hypothetical protein